MLISSNLCRGSGRLGKPGRWLRDGAILSPTLRTSLSSRSRHENPNLKPLHPQCRRILWALHCLACFPSHVHMNNYSVSNQPKGFLIWRRKQKILNYWERWENLRVWKILISSTCKAKMQQWTKIWTMWTFTATTAIFTNFPFPLGGKNAFLTLVLFLPSQIFWDKMLFLFPSYLFCASALRFCTFSVAATTEIPSCGRNKDWFDLEKITNGFPWMACWILVMDS